MMATIILLLLGLLIQALFGVDVVERSPNADAVRQPASAAVVGGLLPVDRVDVKILESFPVQVQAVVYGFLPDSCTELGDISQTREGNEITVTIETTRPADAFCAQVITPVEETVPLEGDFPPGNYTVTVSGVVQTFQV